jgi:hypothetical protein
VTVEGDTVQVRGGDAGYVRTLIVDANDRRGLPYAIRYDSGLATKSHCSVRLPPAAYALVIKNESRAYALDIVASYYGAPLK